MKVMGALLIVSAGAALGLSRARTLGGRARLLTAFVSALELMRAEICTRLTPLPELMEYLSHWTQPPCRLFFASVSAEMEKLGESRFSELWDRALSGQAGLDGDAGAALKALGQSLGRYGRQEQDAAIRLAIARLEQLARQAGEQYALQGRMWTGLGLAGGLMLAILLL